ncbi:hypothetical protein B0H11DRAFT_2252877 [Mycena galericulata]|nr:hypothetical protein B0H11DRAFT_2252877 [Mycena galericulata]
MRVPRSITLALALPVHSVPFGSPIPSELEDIPLMTPTTPFTPTPKTAAEVVWWVPRKAVHPLVSASAEADPRIAVSPGVPKKDFPPPIFSGEPIMCPISPPETWETLTDAILAPPSPSSNLNILPRDTEGVLECMNFKTALTRPALTRNHYQPTAPVGGESTGVLHDSRIPVETMHFDAFVWPAALSDGSPQPSPMEDPFLARDPPFPGTSGSTAAPSFRTPELELT